MKIHKIKKENIYRIFFIFIVIVSSVAIIYSTNNLPPSNKEYDTIQIKDDVKVQYNNEKEKTVNLSDYSFQNNNKLDTLTITKSLPDTQIVNPILNFDLYNCIVEVWVDGEKSYDYGKDIYEKGNLLGHCYFHIPLKENFQGKELKIKITFTETKSYSSLPEIVIMNDANSLLKFTSNNILVILVTMTMILFGLVSLVVSLTRKNYTIEYSNITLIAFFCINIAIWMCCSHKIIFLFVNNFQCITFLEYFSLYVAPIPALLFCARMQSNKTHIKILRFFALICGISVAVALVRFLIWGTNYANVLPIFHIMILATIIAIVYCSAHCFKAKTKSEKILIYGILFMGVVMVLDVVRFNIDKFLVHTHILSMSLIPIGTLVFVLTMIYSYSMQLLKIYSGRTEKEILEMLAYKDILTGLNNRAKCEEIMTELENKKVITAIINFDINNLKIVNDTLGHQSGDEMIKRFSSHLKLVFNDIGFVGRMGGDEFIVFITDNNETMILNRINKFNSVLKFYNQNVDDIFKLSTAIGYAIGKEHENISIWSLYDKADKNMYEDKKAYKDKIQQISGKTKLEAKNQLDL